jgi:hypothetical protein
VSAPAPGAATRQCAACRRRQHEGGGFRLQTLLGSQTRCFLCTLRDPRLLRRSTVIALIVGSVLVVINHGDALAAGRGDATLIWKVPLTYVVPFVVATWGALLNTRVK